MKTRSEAAQQFSQETGMSREKMRRAGISFVPCLCGRREEMGCNGWMAKVEEREA